MDLNSIVGVIRALLAATGGSLIAKGWVSADLWNLIGGFVVSVATGVWSWRANSFGLEQYLGIIRAAAATIGGYVAARGWVTAGQWTQITGVVVTVATAVWSMFFKTATATITKVASDPKAVS